MITLGRRGISTQKVDTVHILVIQSIVGTDEKDSPIDSCTPGDILEYGITLEPNQPRSQEMFRKESSGKEPRISFFPMFLVQ